MILFRASPKSKFFSQIFSQERNSILTANNPMEYVWRISGLYWRDSDNHKISKKEPCWIQQREGKTSNLDNAISLWEVEISGNDSERILFPPWDRSGKTEFESFSWLPFVSCAVELLSQSMFPSEKHLLKNDLETKIQHIK